VTIKYPNGALLQALPLVSDQDGIRAVAPGSGDALAFTRIHGTWISEGLEPVAIEFEWQRRVAVRVPAVDDCICPKELAVRLISALLSGDNTVEADMDTSYRLNPHGADVAIPRTELRLA